MPRISRSPMDPEPGPLRTRQVEGTEPAGDPAYVQASRSVVGNLQALLQRIGTALIGGDFTGGARGHQSVDIQGGRGDPSQVAAGAQSICLGSDNRSARDLCVAIGKGNTADSGNPLYGSVALGTDNVTDGENSVAVGSDCRAVADRSVAVGDTAHAEDLLALAVGAEAHASGLHGIAIGAVAQAGQAALADCDTAIGSHAHAHGPVAQSIGYYAHALAEGAQSLGYTARARLSNTTVISGVLISRRSTLTQDAHEDPDATGFLPLVHGAGALVTITSAVIDLKTLAQLDVTLPAGSLFYIRDFTLEVTNGVAVATQPTVQAGTAAAPTTHLPATATTGLTAKGASCRYFPANWNTGVTTLQAKITVAATGTTLQGRCTWCGYLIEDEA